ncbi:MAG: hypothetical protein K2K57_10270 [Oscillospiraceae bacterium]|nr:hypothetical protein [Oscillospiraceae bacterium]
MNRDELSKMLDLVDEKYLNEALGSESAETATVSATGTVKITAVKRRSMGSGFACIAAALALVIGLTLLTNPTEISVDEKQGAVTDSETVTDIIEPDETEPYDYGKLFSSPVDLGMREFSYYSDGDEVYNYFSDNVNGIFPDRAAALINGRFNAQVSIVYDGSGEVSSANISLISPDSYLNQCTVAISKRGGLWNGFYYAGKTGRLGKTVQSSYCEKTDGLHLWAYCENDGTDIAMYSLGIEKDEAALIFDSFITGSISLDKFTSDEAVSMWQNMTVEQAAALPEFKGKVCTEKNPGDKFLRSENIVVMRLLYKGEAYSSSFAVIYDDSADVNRSVSVDYSNNGKVSANITTVDIESVTPEKITELCRSDEETFCINADGVYVTVSGVYSPGFLKALTDHLKADSD